MAIFCAMISGILSFLFSLVWHLIAGGSVASFFLTYFLLGNLLFLLMLAVFYLSTAFRDWRHHRTFRLRLPADRLV